MTTELTTGPRRVSIAQARDRLPAIVHDVEQHGPVEITRRGEPVAVMLSHAEYRRLIGERTDFWATYERFRDGSDLSALDLGEDVFSGLRDRSPGRDVAV